MNRKKLLIYSAIAFLTTLNSGANLHDWKLWTASLLSSLIAIRALLSNPTTA